MATNALLLNGFMDAARVAVDTESSGPLEEEFDQDDAVDAVEM